MMTGSEGYNGWTNYETWNVALWIGNDEPLYRDAVAFMHRYSGDAPYREFASQLVELTASTPDGVGWLSEDLDYDELDEMMREHAPEYED